MLNWMASVKGPCTESFMQLSNEKMVMLVEDFVGKFLLVYVWLNLWLFVVQFVFTMSLCIRLRCAVNRAFCWSKSGHVPGAIFCLKMCIYRLIWKRTADVFLFQKLESCEPDKYIQNVSEASTCKINDVDCLEAWKWAESHCFMSRPGGVTPVNIGMVFWALLRS